MNEAAHRMSLKKNQQRQRCRCFFMPEAGGAAGRRRINAPCIDATIFLTDARAKEHPDSTLLRNSPEITFALTCKQQHFLKKHQIMQALLIFFQKILHI